MDEPKFESYQAFIHSRWFGSTRDWPLSSLLLHVHLSVSQSAMALQVMLGLLPCSYNSFYLTAPSWEPRLSPKAQSSRNLPEASSYDERGSADPRSLSKDISALKTLLDQELASGNERRALELVSSCGLRGFGTASQVFACHCFLYYSPVTIMYLELCDLYVSMCEL